LCAVFSALFQAESEHLTKIGLIQLGCPKNQVDGEEILGAIAQQHGGSCEFVSDKREADVLIVNTCAFIDSAKEESVNAILDAVRLKSKGRVKRVVVSGCLAQRYAKELAIEIPEVDAFIGVESAVQAPNVIFGDLLKEPSLITPVIDKYPLMPSARLRAGSDWTAYLKIADGCDHACAFCSIPSFRGKHRSKPIERVLDEARKLTSSGAKELCIVAQDTTAYGLDLYKKLALPELLDGLCEIDELKWIRLLYCYPTMVQDSLIETIARQPKVLPYIDIPLQHGDDVMLKSMNRTGTARSYRNLIAKMRDAIENLTVRTSFITGFPGETDEQFDHLLQFVSDVRFDRMGVFLYSKEENTPSASMTDDVSRKIAAKRKDALMAAQQKISLEDSKKWIGREIEVLIEGRNGQDAIGRSQRDAPEIDGVVSVKKCAAQPGEIVRAVVNKATAYDMIAKPVDPS
jgi:ribosomal protein S12 methylthiotransferase